MESKIVLPPSAGFDQAGSLFPRSATMVSPAVRSCPGRRGAGSSDVDFRCLTIHVTAMTLVVAQKKGAILSVVSDTGVSQNGARLPPDKHMPKICVLSPDFAVGFAGSPELALEAIAALNPSATPPDAIHHFREFHRAKAQSVDFILMFQRPVLRLVRIANGGVSSGLAHTAWIGDQTAFEHFQRRRNGRESPSASSIFEVPLMFTDRASERDPDNVTFTMIDAMRYVLDLRHVFGHAVGVSNADGRFEYRQHAFVLDERRSLLSLPASFLQQLAPELHELREYSMSCFVTTHASPRQAVAFHFLRGKVTYIYHGDRGAPLTRYTVARDMNAEEFMTLMRAEGCTDWSGQLLSRLPPPSDYGIAANHWKQVR